MRSLKVNLFQINKIKELYLNGNSSPEIKTALNLPISERQIQRIVKKLGVMRTHREAFVLAIKRGKVVFHKKPLGAFIERRAINKKLRFLILEKYNHRCVSCGATALDDRLQIDHIDENPTNNDEGNLQVLCHSCNSGKAASHGKYVGSIIKK